MNDYKYIPPNKPVLNGGLYTGEPFKGPWGNVPVIADTVYLVNENLKSVNPPPNAGIQYAPYGVRPGNNFHKFEGIKEFSDKHNLHCRMHQKSDEKIKSYNCFQSDLGLW